MYSKLTIGAIDIVLVSLLLSLTIFDTILVVFFFFLDEFKHVNARQNTLLP